MAERVHITQVRSANGANPTQRAALRTLGLGRIGTTTERPEEPTVAGALKVVEHLVKVDR